jgi:IS30 family transposase
MWAFAAEWQIEPQNGEARLGKSIGHLYQQFRLAVGASTMCEYNKLPATLRRSLTWDRGLEMAKHKDFTVATDVKVYFCNPQSPWQRGSNENTNGLLRQYFPKNTDLTDYSQSDLNKVALRLNQRPRQTLGFQTPASKLQESVASTH